MSAAPAHCAAGVVPVYTDTSGDELLAGYAGGGMIELQVPAGCVHLRVSEVDTVLGRLVAIACGRDPADP